MKLLKISFPDLDDKIFRHVVLYEYYSFHVLDPISFSKTPKIQTTQEGSKSKTIICRVTGNPKPTISWRVGKRTLWPGKPSTDSSTGKTVNDLADLSQNKVSNI